MGIEVKQLVINSSIGKEEETNADKSTAEKTDDESVNKGSDCIDIDNVKADIIAECRRMIRKCIEEQRGR